MSKVVSFKYKGKSYKLEFESTGEVLDKISNYEQIELYKSEPDKKTGNIFSAEGLVDSGELVEIDVDSIEFEKSVKENRIFKTFEEFIFENNINESKNTIKYHVFRLGIFREGEQIKDIKQLKGEWVLERLNKSLFDSKRKAAKLAKEKNAQRFKREIEVWGVKYIVAEVKLVSPDTYAYTGKSF